MGARPDAIATAIARAYAVFDRPAPVSLGVCTGCCMDPALERAMLRKHPADLTLAEVREWLDAAFSDNIGRDAVAWMVPRILDLLASGEEVAGAGNEVALSRLPLTGFPDTWAQPEVDAVMEACLGILERSVEERTGDLDRFLCMTSAGGLPVDPFLARLDALGDDTLAALLRANWSSPVGMMIPQSAFWDNRRARDRVWDWYTSRALEDRMIAVGIEGNVDAVAVADMLATYGRSR